MRNAITLIWRQLRRRDLSELAIVLIISILLLAFAKIASEVIEGDTNAFDTTVLLALRNQGDPSRPIGPAWVKGVLTDLTSLGSVTVLSLVVVAVLGFLVASGRRALLRLILISVLGGGLLSAVLKSLFQRPRPHLVPHAIEVYTTSFPSGHAMLSAVVYLTLGALLAHVQTESRVKSYCFVVAITLTLLVGLSRVYLGVHWPSDVFAGWCVGAAWAILCLLVAARLDRRGSDLPGNRRSG